MSSVSKLVIDLGLINDEDVSGGSNLVGNLVPRVLWLWEKSSMAITSNVSQH